ncbi:MAG: class I SAM-dependent methyltransferase [Gammaproteobacteria bacterium]|nr:MAG: class I SAM-dependent methyltransferase [Gammaproteobacteria bacterium]
MFGLSQACLCRARPLRPAKAVEPLELLLLAESSRPLTVNIRTAAFLGEEHMRFKNLFFDLWYRFGKPPWSIDQAQPDLIAAVEKGEVRGPTVLDVGCGDGNNAIYLAGRGFNVTGFDFSAKAISIAKQKASEEKADVTFFTLDALKIGDIDKRFDTVIDFGLFHNLSGDKRKQYVRALSNVCVRKGQFLMLCVADQAGEYPVYPNRYPPTTSQDDIRAYFSEGWKIEWIRLGVAKSSEKFDDYSAWLTSMTFTK